MFLLFFSLHLSSGLMGATTVVHSDMKPLVAHASESTFWASASCTCDHSIDARSMYTEELWEDIV